MSFDVRVSGGIKGYIRPFTKQFKTRKQAEKYINVMNEAGYNAFAYNFLESF